MARRCSIPGVVDVDRFPSDATLLDAASHLVFSESAMIERSGTDDIDAGLRAVAADTSAQVSVTLGERGVTWLDDGQIRHLDAFDVDAIDTTGAGDTFHGAFTLALAERMAESDAFRFAAAAAALKCAHPGGRAGIPNRAEVDDYLESFSTTVPR